MELKKIKLNKLSDDALAQRQMKGLKGGGVIQRHCTCSCAYANAGGSSTNDNMAANYRLGSRVVYSKTGDNDSEMEYNSNISLTPLSQESKQALEVR